jgi:DNA-binding transcriptional MerR regulator
MPPGKAADAFRTISEAADEIGVPQHVLRHWEEVFGQIRPMRRAGGRRYYRPQDLDILRGVKVLLYEQGYTTKGVQKIFKDSGAKFVAELGKSAMSGAPFELRPLGEELLDPADIIEASASAEPDGADEPLELTTPMAETRKPKHTPASAEIRERLTALLAKLERVQESLDEAALALEAIEAGVQTADERRRRG